MLVRNHRPDVFLVNLIAWIRAELQGELDVSCQQKGLHSKLC